MSYCAILAVSANRLQCLCRRLGRGLSCVAARSSTVHRVEASRLHHPIVEDIGCDKQTRWFGNPAPFKPLLGTTRQLVGQGGCRHLEVVNGASARPQPPTARRPGLSRRSWPCWLLRSSSDQGAPARGSVAPRAHTWHPRWRDGRIPVHGRPPSSRTCCMSVSSSWSTDRDRGPIR